MERKDLVDENSGNICVELLLTQEEMRIMRGGLNILLAIRRANSLEDLWRERGIADEVDIDVAKKMNGIIEDPIGSHEQRTEAVQ
jgi:hypothetical protein